MRRASTLLTLTVLSFVSLALAAEPPKSFDVVARGSSRVTDGDKVSGITAAGDVLTVLATDQDKYWVQSSRGLKGWIDANGVYYDRYESEHFENRRIFSRPVRQELGKIFQRRCAGCHGSDDGQHDTWWLSLNRRDIRLSRALAAPLSVAAGGWGRCEGTVFADASDPDYQALLAVLTALRATLDEHPREDLLSLRGTAAERQVVGLPPPPKPVQTAPKPPALRKDCTT